MLQVKYKEITKNSKTKEAEVDPISIRKSNLLTLLEHKQFILYNCCAHIIIGNTLLPGPHMREGIAASFGQVGNARKKPNKKYFPQTSLEGQVPELPTEKT